MTDSCKEIFGSSHHRVFTLKSALRTMLWVQEFEPSLFAPGVYFNIKCIGKLPGPTNEFEQSLVFETDKFERPKFDSISKTFIGQNYFLTLCMLGNFVLLLLSSADFLKKILIFRKLFQEHWVSNDLVPDQDRCSVQPDLGPNCLQIFSADNTSRH